MGINKLVSADKLVGASNLVGVGKTVNLQIASLRDYPDLLTVLARYHHAEWHKLSPNTNLRSRIKKLQKHLSCDPVPETFVAMEQGQLMGSASVVYYQFPNRLGPTPWLTNVYVQPSYRSRGIGTRLVEAVEQYCRSLSLNTLYLFTPDRADFYASRSWQYVRQTSMSGQVLDVMSRAL